MGRSGQGKVSLVLFLRTGVKGKRERRSTGWVTKGYTGTHCTARRTEIPGHSWCLKEEALSVKGQTEGYGLILFRDHENSVNRRLSVFWSSVLSRLYSCYCSLSTVCVLPNLSYQVLLKIVFVPGLVCL